MEDRRFQTGRTGRGMRVPMRRGTGMGLGGIVILLLLSVFFGQDFLSLLGAAGGAGGVPMGSGPPTFESPATSGTASAEEEEMVDFVSFVLDDLQGTWSRIFQERGGQYHPARLVLFRDAIRSACGFAQSASGPFYCPGDQKVYVDLNFFEELKRRFEAPGDFAQAYVLAHEIGHHVQTITGIESQVRQAQQSRPRDRNRIQVLMELQADCYAGVWGHSTAQRNMLDPGDVDEGLTAAAAIGDDRIQRQSTGRINPESFTHGSSAQRAEWLRRGLQSGNIDNCDTWAGM